MAEIVVSAAFGALQLGLASVPFFNSFHRPDFDRIRNMLQRMQAYMRDPQGGGEEDNEWNRKQMLQMLAINDLAYEIEDIFEKFRLKVAQHTVTRVFRDPPARLRFNRAVKEVFAKIKEIKDLNDILPSPSDPAPHVASSSGSGQPTPKPYLVSREDELVGIDKRASELMRAILEGESHLAVVSLLGPQGSGKTTVMKEVFRRLKEEPMFQLCVWINFPGGSNSKTLLDTVVSAVGGPTSGHLEIGAEDRLAGLLKEKRYALFVDGISRKVDWSHVGNLLPNDFNGSRVIISTQEQDVASYCARHSGNVHKVKKLDWEESWTLLCKIAFRGLECPKALVECTEILLNKCEGLPFHVVSMGHHLSTRPQNPREFWKQHVSLGHELGGSSALSDVGRSLLTRYNRLSHNKKCCFLYFGNFPEDRSVTRGRLIRLWIAERFVEEVTGMTPEEVAEEYLNELIKMDLVITKRVDSQEIVRSCTVENLVLKFILSRSDEAFCSVLQESSSVLGEKRPIRRMSLQGFGSSKHLTGVDLSRVRSLQMFTSDPLTGKPLDSFSLLRVLDFEDAKLQHFPQEIVKLRLLRYLSLRNTEVKEIPNNIKKLQSLVTLDLRQTLITKLPKGIKKLQSLVFLLVTHKYSILEGVDVVRHMRNLKSLQKLSLVKANRNNWNSFAADLKSMTELRKLGISGLSREDGSALCESLFGMKKLYALRVISASQQQEELVDLDSLEPNPYPCLRNLYLAGHLPNWIGSLGSLVKLQLQWSRLTSSRLEGLHALPCLVELKLADDAYVNDRLMVEAGWFGNLKVLELQRLNLLEIVEVKPGAMPQLTKLDIRGCGKMAVPPLGIENRKNLELLLLDMPNIISLQQFLDLLT